MTIISSDATTAENKKRQYQLTRNPATKKLTDATDNIISVCGYCYYDDSKEEGKEKIILTLLTSDGIVYGTNSKTAQDNFDDILEFFEDDMYEDEGSIPVKVVTSESKNKRTFVMLEYAG